MALCRNLTTQHYTLEIIRYKAEWLRKLRRGSTKRGYTGTPTKGGGGWGCGAYMIGGDAVPGGSRFPSGRDFSKTLDGGSPRIPPPPPPKGGGGAPGDDEKG